MTANRRGAGRPVLPPTLAWRGDVATGHLELVDQTVLPGTVAVLACRDVDTLIDAVRRLVVRGAPALGVAGAYGVVLAARRLLEDSVAKESAEASFLADCQRIALARPTAVNLALGVGLARAAWLARSRGSDALRAGANAALTAARRLHREDAAACRAMGRHGADFIEEGGSYLTHCNTGALATAGQGTAFSVFAEARRLKRDFSVLVDETRPLLQGARLTALECAANGIKARLICDNAAGGLMARGMVDGIFLGADRIAANGDFANKVGTYSLAVLAAVHEVPFYCVAPTTTIDLDTSSGADIDIEERDPSEVRSLNGHPVAPAGFPAINPAFDVTPAELVTALITERGVVRSPNARKVRQHLR